MGKILCKKLQTLLDAVLKDNSNELQYPKLSGEITPTDSSDNNNINNDDE